MQEAVFMMRKNEWIGTLLIVFGAGFLLSAIISSLFWTVFSGIVFVVLGCLLAAKKC